MSRIAYFKNALAQTDLDAGQTQLISTLTGQYATLSQTVASKADLSAHSALSATVDSKASSQDLTALNIVVNGKASQSQVSAISETVDSKASSQSVVDLTAIVTTKAPTSSLVSLSSSVNDKLVLRAMATDLTTLENTYNARIVNEAVFFGSVKESIHFADANGVELDYVALGLVVAPPAAQ